MGQRGPPASGYLLLGADGSTQGRDGGRMEGAARRNPGATCLGCQFRGPPGVRAAERRGARPRGVIGTERDRHEFPATDQARGLHRRAAFPR